MTDTDILELTAEIVAAYVANNSLPAQDLPTLIVSTYAAIADLDKPAAAIEPEPPRVPAVPIKKSVADDYIISLENGRKFKSLKRHLMATYGMTPDQYREKWGLPATYPMVAPAYAKQRSQLAKDLGLGRPAATVQ